MVLVQKALRLIPDHQIITLNYRIDKSSRKNHLQACLHKAITAAKRNVAIFSMWFRGKYTLNF